MPRIIKSGLIQMSLPKTEGEGTIAGDHRRDGSRSTSRSLKKAGQQGRADPLPAGDLQHARTSALARTGSLVRLAPRAVPGPTTELHGQVREEVQHGHHRSRSMRSEAGRRAVQHRCGDRRGRHLPGQVPQEPHSRTRAASGRSSSSSPATSAIRSSKRNTPRWACTSVTTATSPTVPACLGLNGAEIVYNPSATVAGSERVPLEAGATRARCGERLLHGMHQPRRRGEAVEPRQVLRSPHISWTRAARSIAQASREYKDELLDFGVRPRYD